MVNFLIFLVPQTAKMVSAMVSAGSSFRSQYNRRALVIEGEFPDVDIFAFILGEFIGQVGFDAFG